jgi:hypothetical protein
MEGRFGNFKNYPELWLPVPLMMCMKTYCWFNQNNPLSHLRIATQLLLACLTTLFISATSSAVASDIVPFNGTVSGYVESQEPVDQCTVHAHVVNFGNANQLGAFTGTAEFYPNFCQDPPNITYTGMFDWFAANGDEIYGTFNGYLSPTETPGVYDNHETAEVTGGTGRFASATGHFELGGQLDFTTSPPSFVLPWQGWISTVGSTRR